jgi:AcrR family transcriptional regulator
LIHEAFFYASDDDFAAGVARFLRDAVAADQGAIAVTTEARIALLRRRLRSAADGVWFFDAAIWYRRPGAALVAWRDALDRQAREGANFVCAIGEIPFATDEGARRVWSRYESMLNRAFAGRPAWIVCPYNTKIVSPGILEDASHTHPTRSTVPARGPSTSYFEAQELGAPITLAEDRADAKERVGAVAAPPHGLTEARRKVRWDAHAAGLSVNVVDDLLLAVAELVQGAPAGDGAAAFVRTAHHGGEWFCEVRSGSRDSNAPPLSTDEVGVLIGRVICDRVELAEDHTGWSVRFVFGKPADARQRILTAAAELFRENGVRATGINAVIEHAGVAKATFYAHFQSKDELIHLWLRSPAARWFDQVRAEIEARSQTPAERLTTFFDVLGEWLAEDEFRGCPFLNTATEFRSADRPFTQELADLTLEIEDYFRRAAAEAGFANPESVADQLFLLVPGTITAATARASAEPARTARATAAALVESAAAG